MRHEQVAKLARAFAHPLRVGILQHLRCEPAMVGELVTALEVEPSRLSKHLAVLRDAGLVECDVQWRCRQYRLRTSREIEGVLDALEYLSENIDNDGGHR